MSVIQDEMKRRNNKDESIYQLVGVEIRNRRISMSKTLSSLANETCSLSYVCKIEKNAIVPNKTYLKEICEKVEISPEKLESIMDLKTILFKTIDAFYYSDNEKIAAIKSEILSLENYRAMIIMFIIHIYEKNYNVAARIVRNIERLIKEISDFDLITYVTFIGILNYYREKFFEASDDIKSAIDSNLGNETLKLLQQEYLFKIAYATNSQNTYEYYRKLCYTSYDLGNLAKYQEINYLYGIYCLRNNNYKNFTQTYNSISDVKYKKNLEILENIVLKHENRIEEIEKASFEYMLLYFKKTDENKFIDLVMHSSEMENLSPTEMVYIKYLESSIVGGEIEFSFLNDVALPSAIDKMNGFLIGKYFIKWRKFIYDQCKYKKSFDTMTQIISAYEMISKI